MSALKFVARLKGADLFSPIRPEHVRVTFDEDTCDYNFVAFVIGTPIGPATKRKRYVERR